MKRIEFDSNKGVQFVVGNCTYYEVLTQIIKLENETFTAIINNNASPLDIREKYIPNAITAQRLMLKPFGLGCAVITALKCDKSYEILIHKRSDDLATYPGARAAVPNFGLEPISGNIPHARFNGTEMLFYNFIKEYIEEIFNYEHMIMQAQSKKIDPFWFYEASPEAKSVIKALKAGSMKLIYLGFGFDCLNGVPVLAFLSKIDDVDIVNQIKNNKDENWEGKIEILDYKGDRDSLQEWLKCDEYHPGAAYAISRTLKYLDQVR